MVQRRAARWVTGRYHNTSSVSDMLRGLDWRSLEQRKVDSSRPSSIKYETTLWQLMRIFIYREVLGAETTLAFPSSPGQSYRGTSFQVKSAWQSRSIPSRLRSRGSSTLDSFSSKHFFYLFCLFLPLLLLPFQFLFYSNPSSLLLLLPFPFSHSTGDNPHS